MRLGISFVAALGMAIAVVSTGTHQAQAPEESALTRRAAGIHERVMTLDSHVDIKLASFAADHNYTQDLGTHVNLPKMVKGGLDAAFFIVYVEQDRSADAF